MGKNKDDSQVDKKPYYVLCCDLNDSSALKILAASDLYKLMPNGLAIMFKPKSKRFDKNVEFGRKVEHAGSLMMARYHIYEIDDDLDALKSTCQRKDGKVTKRFVPPKRLSTSGKLEPLEKYKFVSEEKEARQARIEDNQRVKKVKFGQGNRVLALYSKFGKPDQEKATLTSANVGGLPEEPALDNAVREEACVTAEKKRGLNEEADSVPPAKKHNKGITIYGTVCSQDDTETEVDVGLVQEEYCTTARTEDSAAKCAVLKSNQEENQDDVGGLARDNQEIENSDVSIAVAEHSAANFPAQNSDMIFLNRAF